MRERCEIEPRNSTATAEGRRILGQRRSVTITTSDELLAEADQRAIIATLRLAFATTQPAGSEAVALTFNLATG